MNNKGLIYEKYVKQFIRIKLNKQVYLWNECPENILIDNNLVSSHNNLRIIRKNIKEGNIHHHKDIGIDLIQIEDNNISLIQAKNGYSNGVRIEDLAGIMMRTSFSRKDAYIYYTNNLSNNIRKTGELSNLVRFIENTDELLDKTEANIHFVHLPIIKNKKEKTKNIFIPYSYQLDAIKNFNNYYDINNRGILSLPCGCGKTYISYKISNNFDKIILISPLREFALQNLNKFIEYGYENKTILIDTDGTRNIEEIKKFLMNNKKCLLSTTYKSIDIISNCLELFENSLFIIDEFHNISKTNLLDETNDMYKLLYSNHKILFVSATPRIYDIEDEIEDFNDIIGNIVYSMKFNEAISNNYICDYRLWLPSVSENNDELNRELSIYEIDNSIKNRCKYLYSCILNNGSRKIIIYSKDTNDMIDLIDGMKILNEFFILDIEINSISCDNSEKERKEILKNFSENNDKIQLLFNIKILNECIDIPSCDSIYISYPPKSKITTIQRISRATRKDINNPHKIANVFIWCDEYDEILKILSIFKEYDLLFKDKIKLNQINYYNSKEIEYIELIKNDIKTIYNVIINCKEYIQYTFEEKLEIIEKYVKENGKFPSIKDDKSLILWIRYTKSMYKKNKLNDIHNKLWEDFMNRYPDLFLDNVKMWLKKFKILEEFVEKNDRFPTNIEYDWFSTQRDNYKNNYHIMKNEEIKKIWEDFIEKYCYLLKDYEEIWINKFKLLENYVKIHNKFPSNLDKNEENKTLSIWRCYNNQSYKNNKNIMKNEKIKNIWEEFIDKYNYLFKDNFKNWYENLQKADEYILKNGKRPNDKMKNKEDAIIGNWITIQNKNYKKVFEIMKNETIRNEWENFIKKHYILFMNYEEKWNYTLTLLKDYIKKNNRLPKFNDNDTNSKILYSWYIRNKNKEQIEMTNFLIEYKDYI